jgi:hypothetical protein
MHASNDSYKSNVDNFAPIAVLVLFGISALIYGAGLALDTYYKSTASTEAVTLAAKESNCVKLRIERILFNERLLNNKDLRLIKIDC